MSIISAKIVKCRVVLIISCLFLINSVFAKAEFNNINNSYVGYWKTYDMHSPQPRSIIKVVEHKNNYIGHIVKVFYSNKANSEYICSKCMKGLKNKPLLGLKVLWIQRNHQKNTRNHCHVLNPDNGKFYTCHVQLAKNGTVLEIHPYLGIPLFGVTLNWQRTTNIDKTGAQG